LSGAHYLFLRAFFFVEVAIAADGVGKTVVSSPSSVFLATFLYRHSACSFFHSKQQQWVLLSPVEPHYSAIFSGKKSMPGWHQIIDCHDFSSFFGILICLLRRGMGTVVLVHHQLLFCL
jgi:hypothetical protein